MADRFYVFSADPAASVVSSLDGITGAASLVAGANVTITDNSPVAGDITIAATGGGAGVTALDGITGAVSLVAGAGVTITDNSPVASDITIAATGGGGSAIIFDSTLAVDTATIDTGAGGIAGGYDAIDVFVYARTDEAVPLSQVNMTFNNDTGANYDLSRIRATGTGTSPAYATSFGRNNLFTNMAGASTSNAHVFGEIALRIPNYTGTTGFKAAVAHGAVTDTTDGNTEMTQWGYSYRATVAITRFAVTPNTPGNKLKAGSRVTIVGYK